MLFNILDIILSIIFCVIYVDIVHVYHVLKVEF